MKTINYYSGRNEIAIRNDIKEAQRRGLLHEKIQYEDELAQYYLNDNDAEKALDIYLKMTKQHKYHHHIVTNAQIRIVEVYCRIGNRPMAFAIAVRLLPHINKVHKKALTSVLKICTPVWLKPIIAIRLAMI